MKRFTVVILRAEAENQSSLSPCACVGQSTSMVCLRHAIIQIGDLGVDADIYTPNTGSFQTEAGAISAPGGCA